MLLALVRGGNLEVRLDVWRVELLGSALARQGEEDVNAEAYL